MYVCVRAFVFFRTDNPSLLTASILRRLNEIFCEEEERMRAESHEHFISQSVSTEGLSTCKFGLFVSSQQQHHHHHSKSARETKAKQKSRTPV